MFRCEIIVDSFAGGGGASLGIQRALGRSPDVAINHDAAAIEMHAANHPETKHFTEDVWKVSPRQVTRGRRVGLLWASPDCFPAGTLILTYEGYRPIEEIREGDLVLTHLGRWRTVTATMQSCKETVIFSGRGHCRFEVSLEHPILARQSKEAQEEWVRASDAGAGMFWATPRRVDHVQSPALPAIPELQRLWWIVGRYLADGWTRIRSSGTEMTLTVGDHKAESARVVLADTGITWGERNTDTATQFTCYRGELVYFLRTHFGHLAQHKTIPGWVACLPVADRKELLDGYFAGDGCRIESLKLNEASTTSRALLYGLRLLIESLGWPTTIYHGKNRDTVIDGRTVSARHDIYKLKWRDSINADHVQYGESDNHRWYRITDKAPGRSNVPVFNISVENDESYVAEGIVVHNCKHFSRAKGSKPVKKSIRSLAWVVVKWAAECKPRVIVLENVREFEEWGPLLPKQTCFGCGWKGTEGQTLLGRGKRRRCPSCDSVRLRVTEELVPDPARKGLTFKRFVGRLRNLGYRIEWRSLNAADYGAPTHRRRLFLIARNDGAPIEWPEPTHGDPKKLANGERSMFGPCLQPWRTAAEFIDWSIPCPSIFERKKPLAEKTLRRIAMGIKRYVLDNPTPFIVPVTHSGERRTYGVDEPIPTVTGAHRGELALVTPTLINCAYGDNGRYGDGTADLNKPIGTIHSGGKNFAVVAPTLVRFRGDAESVPSIQDPCPTITAGSFVKRPAGAGHALGIAVPILVGAGGPDYAAKPREVDRPIGSLTAEPRTALVSAFIAKHFGDVVGHDTERPIGTVTARDHHSVVAANLIRMNYGEKQWNSPDEPLPTITSGNHAALVYSFLIRYFGTSIGQAANDPLHTTTTKDRSGLVTVTIGGEPFIIADIGMRMLTPRELARCQGFPDDYVLTGTKTSQVARIGNSVAPDVAAAIVEANCAAVAA